MPNSFYDSLIHQCNLMRFEVIWNFLISMYQIENKEVFRTE